MKKLFVPLALSAAKGRFIKTVQTALLFCATILGTARCAKAQYNYSIENGTVTITAYTGSGGAVTIPGTIDGLPVTGIGGYNIYEDVYNGAFENCYSLTSVTIPNSVTSIGVIAFFGCTSLTSVAIPGSVTSIGDGAFEDCGLTSVTIPDSVTSIGNFIFAYCSSLTAITVNAQNSAFSSMNGVLFDKNQLTLLAYPGGLGGSYIIPSSVTSIGSEAFFVCTNLTSINIPTSVTSIGEEAFTGCARLTNLVIPNSVTSIAQGGFENCYSLTNITIGTNVSSIGDYAFYNCIGLTSLTLPKSVTSIGDKAFTECSSLGSVYFQGNAPSADSSVFLGENATVYYLAGTTGWASTFGGVPTASFNITAQNGTITITGYAGSVGTVAIPGTINGLPVTSIGTSAFEGASLTTVTIPLSVTSIGTSAFEGASLTTVTIPLSVTSIGIGAFESCPSLASVTFPNSITNLGADAFAFCTNLTGIYFQGNAPASDSTAFLGDNTTVYYPPGTTGWGSMFGGLPTALLIPMQFNFTTQNGAVTITGYTGPGGAVAVPGTVSGMPVISIGTGAFSNIDSLTSVAIPNSVTTIEEAAFDDCAGLTNVTIPEDVTNIVQGTFSGCASLTSITVAAQNSFYSSVNGVVFDKTQTTLVECPEGLNGSYSIPNSVTNIGAHAFAYCDYLDGVTIPGSVISIGDYAFADCGNLAGITIPNSVTSIGDYAFYYCCDVIDGGIVIGGLSTVTIGTGVTSIGAYAFAGCGNLGIVTIGNGITNIGGYAFAYCESLNSVYFQGNAPAADATVFAGDYGFVPGEGIDVTAYYLPGTTGWDAFSANAGIPTTVFLFNFTIQNGTVTITGYSGSGGAETIPSMIGGLQVTSIGGGAFSNIISLTSVTIPASVTSTGDYAFAGCGNLGYIYFQGNAPTVDSTVFEDDNATVYYLTGTMGWGSMFGGLPTSPFLFLFTIQNGTVTITGCSGSGGAATIPSTIAGLPVTTIGDQALFDTSLTSITIGNNVTSIAEFAFYFCPSLTSVTIPSSVTNIGVDAFYDCQNLTSVYFQGNAPTADSSVFLDDDNVVVYYVPETTGWGTAFGSSPTAVWPSGVQFTANPTYAPVGLAIQFNCPSVGSGGNAITNWNWNFGDGISSTLQNPTHVYTTASSFAPVLIAVNTLGTPFPGSGPSINVSPPPNMTGLSLSKTNLVFKGANGFSGLTYYVLASTNFVLPKSQWTVVATNNWSANGNFSFTVTNAISGRQKFYRLDLPSIDINIFQDTFDPTTSSAISSYDGGDVANYSLGVVSGVGTDGSAALQIKASFNNGPNGYGYLAAQWQDQTVSGNADTNLSDYVLSFDAYVTGDVSHQSGGGFQLQLQETTGQYFSTPFPQGTLQTYQAYQGGSDLLLPQSGVWQHFTINLGGPTFQSPNGVNNNFNPTGGTWQIIFQMNEGDWGSAPQIGSTLLIDNLVLTLLTPP